jgi:hypothetical protein
MMGHMGRMGPTRILGPICPIGPIEQLTTDT